jgi:hypothetical protein
MPTTWVLGHFLSLDVISQRHEDSAHNVARAGLVAACNAANHRLCRPLWKAAASLGRNELSDSLFGPKFVDSGR